MRGCGRKVDKGKEVDMTRRLDDSAAVAEFHRRRAARELEERMTAANPSAARAHLQLSSLHFRRAREIDRRPGEPLLPM
jgi:hypothetical protein